MMQETRILERYALVSAFDTRTRLSLPCCAWLRDGTGKLQLHGSAHQHAREKPYQARAET